MAFSPEWDAIEPKFEALLKFISIVMGILCTQLL